MTEYIKCETCLYNKNCQFLAKHRNTIVEGCSAYKNAADVTEVVHSNWQVHVSEDGYEHHFCPECGEDAIFDYVNEPMYDKCLDGEMEYCGDVEVGISEHITPYCPNCGARMS